MKRLLTALTVLTVIPSSTVAFAENITLNQGDYGVDVSEHNKNLDFATLKSQNNKFAIIRLGYGAANDESQRDKSLAAHVQSARDSKTSILAFYHYSYAKTIAQAKEEAQQAIRHLKQVNADPNSYVVYDIEQYGKNAVNDDLNDMIIAFFNEITAAGYKPMLYTGYNFYHANLNADRMKDFDKWIAHYGAVTPTNNESQLLAVDPSLKDKVSAIPNTRLWQFSSTSSWSGYNGVLDKNVLLTNLSFEDNLSTANTAQPRTSNELTVNHVDENDTVIKTEKTATYEDATAATLDTNQYFWLSTSRSGDVVTKVWKKKTWTVEVKDEATDKVTDTITLNSQEEFDNFDDHKFESDTLELRSSRKEMKTGTWKKILTYRTKENSNTSSTPATKTFKVRHVIEDTGEEISTSDVESLDVANNSKLDEDLYFYRGSSTVEDGNVTTVTKKWVRKSWTVKIVDREGHEISRQSLTQKEYDDYEFASNEYNEISTTSSRKNGVYEKIVTVEKKKVIDVPNTNNANNNNSNNSTNTNNVNNANNTNANNTHNTNNTANNASNSNNVNNANNTNTTTNNARNASNTNNTNNTANNSDNTNNTNNSNTVKPTDNTAKSKDATDKPSLKQIHLDKDLYKNDEDLMKYLDKLYDRWFEYSKDDKMNVEIVASDDKSIVLQKSKLMTYDEIMSIKPIDGYETMAYSKSSDNDGTFVLEMRKKSTVAKPNDANSEKSADNTTKPVDNTTKSADNTAKPADNTAKSVDNTIKPSDNTAEPKDNVTKPSEDTKQSKDDNTKVKDNVTKPSEDTKQSKDGTQSTKSAEDTAQPKNNQSNTSAKATASAMKKYASTGERSMAWLSAIGVAILALLASFNVFNRKVSNDDAEDTK